MRIKILTLLIFIILILCGVISCGEPDDISEIKVGMTYDEVENLLGKPRSISRGANELYYDIDEIRYDILQRLNLDTTKAMQDENRWLAPHQIKTVGNLIYVNWIYDKTKSDTFFVLLNNFREQNDTTVSTYPVYYLGKTIVSKSIFDDSDGYLYRIPEDKIVTKSEYEIYMKGWSESKPKTKKANKRRRSFPPKLIEKRIEYKKDVKVNTYDVRESIQKIYYEVDYLYNVIFDASSGRVTLSEYFPFYVNELHSEIIREAE